MDIFNKDITSNKTIKLKTNAKPFSKAVGYSTMVRILTGMNRIENRLTDILYPFSISNVFSEFHLLTRKNYTVVFEKKSYNAL